MPRATTNMKTTKTTKPRTRRVSTPTQKPTVRARRPRAAKPEAPTRRMPAIKEKMSKAQIFQHLADETELSKKQVAAVFDEFEVLIHRHIKPRSVGQFNMSGLFKIARVRKPASKKRMGRNPATGEAVQIAAKPASTRVRVSALKRLKEMIV